jgi:hypothetical protein
MCIQVNINAHADPASLDLISCHWPWFTSLQPIFLYCERAKFLVPQGLCMHSTLCPTFFPKFMLPSSSIY